LRHGVLISLQDHGALAEVMCSTECYSSHYYYYYYYFYFY